MTLVSWVTLYTKLMPELATIVSGYVGKDLIVQKIRRTVGQCFSNILISTKELSFNFRKALWEQDLCSAANILKAGAPYFLTKDQIWLLVEHDKFTSLCFFIAQTSFKRRKYLIDVKQDWKNSGREYRTYTYEKRYVDASAESFAEAFEQSSSTRNRQILLIFYKKYTDNKNEDVPVVKKIEYQSENYTNNDV